MVLYAPQIKVKGNVFYGQEPPSEESTTTECGLIINYLVDIEQLSWFGCVGKVVASHTES